MPQRVSGLLNKIGHKNSDQSDESIVIPLNYAQLLGLRGRDLYLDPTITSAHDDLYNTELDTAYSSVAQLGKEKLLYAAREGLRTARGRVSLIHPDIAVEPILLPGAMAVLEQAGQYDLTIQLAQQAKSVSQRDLHPQNRATMRDYARDVTLATALSHCGLAKRDLEAGRTAMGCARLEEALFMLRESGSGSSSLAPELQSNLVTALSDLKGDAIVDYLRQPLQMADASLRKQALSALGGMLSKKAGQSGQELTVDYAARALSSLSTEEICNIVDWKRIASATPGTYTWASPALLAKIGLAHIVSGFCLKKPEVVVVATVLLRAAHAADQEIDVAIHLSVCEVLLGAPIAALEILKEDERHGASLWGKPAHPARSSYSAAAAAASLAFPERDGVMNFIRAASPEGDADLLPGLCLFVEQWMLRLAFPEFRETKETPPLDSLAVYFEDPHVQVYLESRENAFNVGKVLTEAIETVASLPRRLLSLLLAQKQAAYTAGAAAALLAAVVFIAGQGLQAQRRSASGQAPGGAAAARPAATRPSRSTSTPTKSSTAQERSRKSGVLLPKDTAQNLVKQWLDIKAEAMGPRHAASRLSSVLAEPMLSAVSTEAREAASSGWFWNIRPLRARVESVDESFLTPEGGYAVVVATVDESADLWATNGKKGDSYKTEYKVEYSMVRAGGGWKIASALVLGK